MIPKGNFRMTQHLHPTERKKKSMKRRLKSKLKQNHRQHLFGIDLECVWLTKCNLNEIQPIPSLLIVLNFSFFSFFFFVCVCRWSIQSDGVSVEAALIEKLFNQPTYICGFYWYEAKRTLCRIITMYAFFSFLFCFTLSVFCTLFVVAVLDSIATLNSNGSFVRISW